MRFIKQYLIDFWNLLFPKSCEACGRSLNRTEEVICFDCLYELPRTNFSSQRNNPVHQLFDGRMNIQLATALFFFHKGSPYRHLLHSLKYSHKPQIGVFLGKELGAEILASGLYSDIDYIVPVPLHPKRQKQRGYNQSERISFGISQILNIPVCNNVLIRNMETQTQTKMNKEERWQNVSGKFIVTDTEIFKNKHVLLVDDVITTGATTEACGNVLLQISGLKLSIAVLARA